MLFFIALLIIAIACSAITIKTLVGYSDMNGVFKAVIGGIVILGWLSFPLTPFLAAHNVISSQGMYICVVETLYILMGFVFVLFMLIMIRDVIWYIVYGIAKASGYAGWAFDPKNLSSLTRANQIVVVLALLITGYAFYNGYKEPVVNEVSYSSDKIKHDISIAQLSDLHISRMTPVSRVQHIVSQVNMLNPDVIVLTGDTIDDAIPYIEDRLAALKELSAPYGVYSIMGNHEFYHDVYASKRALDALGLNFLFNGGAYIGNSSVFIVGIPDLVTMAERINFWRAIYKSEKKDYKVLLSHSPNIIDSLSKGLVDLVLSGHTHGGQFFPLHWLIKQTTGYLSGQYTVNGTDLYVSRGIGTWGPQMRLFAPSDITLIHLSKK